MDPQPDDEQARRERLAFEQGVEHAMRQVTAHAYEINNLSVAALGHLSLARHPMITTAETTARVEHAERNAQALLEAARQLLQCVVRPQRTQAEVPNSAPQESAREREDRERAVFEEHLDITLNLVWGLAEDVRDCAVWLTGHASLAAQDDHPNQESKLAYDLLNWVAKRLEDLTRETRLMARGAAGRPAQQLDGLVWLLRELPSWSSTYRSSLQIEIDSRDEDLRFNCQRADTLGLAIQRLIEHTVCAHGPIYVGRTEPVRVTLSARRVESIVETPAQVGAHIVLSLPTPTTSRLGPEARPANWPLGASAEPWGTETLLKAYLLTRRAGGRLRFEPAGERGPCFEIWLPASPSTA